MLLFSGFVVNMNKTKKTTSTKISENVLISSPVLCQGKKLPHNILIAICEPPIEISAKAS